MKLWMLSVLMVLLPAGAYAKRPSAQKFTWVQGFLQASKNPKIVIIDTGTYLYHLKRQETFLKNQLEFRKPASHYLKLKVAPSDILRKKASPTQKSASEAI